MESWRPHRTGSVASPSQKRSSTCTEDASTSSTGVKAASRHHCPAKSHKRRRTLIPFWAVIRLFSNRSRRRGSCKTSRNTSPTKCSVRCLSATCRGHSTQCSRRPEQPNVGGAFEPRSALRPRTQTCVRKKMTFQRPPKRSAPTCSSSLQGETGVEIELFLRRRRHYSGSFTTRQMPIPLLHFPLILGATEGNRQRKSCLLRC